MIKVQRARAAMVWALLAGAVLVLFAGLIFVPFWVAPSLSEADLSGVLGAQQRVTLQQAQGQLQNNIRSTLLQAFGGVLLIGGAIGTWRQVQISRVGQITDRLTRAIDQLGNDKVDVRIGGIYALERLAKDSAADRDAIEEILAAFIRAHASWPVGHRSHPDPHPTADVDKTMLWLTDRAPDVRTAVLVLGRHPRALNDQRLALRRVDLRRTNFYSGTFINLDFQDSNLAGCWAARVRWEMCRFVNADLRETDFSGAVLDQSDFTWAHMQDADLERASLHKANLTNASLCGANLRDADLRNSNLTEADVRGANLSGAKLAGAQLINIQADQSTTWPSGYTP